MRHATLSVVLAAATVVAAAPASAPAELEPPAPTLEVSATEVSATEMSATAPTISVSLYETCARFPDGSVKCWGVNWYGGLGYGTSSPSRGAQAHQMGADLPVIDLGTGRTASSVASGALSACAVLDDGTVKCWGNNNNGQLGLGDNVGRGSGPSDMGDDLPAVELGAGRTATAVTGPVAHTCALLDNGTVKCWGGNGSGQLGLGNTTGHGQHPGEMGDALPAANLGTGRTATAVATGVGHTCALLDNATVKCWGGNASGQLGLGDIASRGDEPGEMGDALPPVNLGTGRTATAIAAGGDHTCALLDNATVKCWGENDDGQLGQGDTFDRGNEPREMGDTLHPVNLGTGRTATAITTGWHHTCALLDNATVKCWGDNVVGQLGQGDTFDRGNEPGEMGDTLHPVNLGSGRTATAIAADEGIHTCAVLDDASIKCWGDNENGRLGLGDTIHRGDQPGEMGDALPRVALTGTGVGGRVTDASTGEPLDAPLLGVLSANDLALARESVGTGDGYFGIELPVGRYFLYLMDQGGTHAPGFFGVPTPITVATGSTTVNPTMAPTRGAISGTVTDAVTASPVGGGFVLALDGTGAVERGVRANGSGQYRLPDLRPGPHHVVAVDPTGGHQARFHPSAPSLPGSTPVSVAVGSTATADISVPSQPAGTATTAIVGQLFDAQSIKAGAWVLALRADDFSVARATTTDVSGRYSLPVPAGGYRVAFIDPSGLDAMEWYDDQPASALDHATTVTAPVAGGSAVLDSATLARPTGTIVGRALQGNVSWWDIWVVAIGPEGIAAAASSRGANGFTFTGLAPGTYRLAVVDPATGHIEYWQDQAGYDQATPITVTADSTVTILPDFGAPPP